MKNHTIPTKLRSGDEVIVIAGKDIGKKGTIREISKYKNKAIVTGINMVKKHTKPNPEMGVTKSFPADLHHSRKSLFTFAQTVCNPLSLSSVLQQPSLYHPVKGLDEHNSKSPPKTFFCFLLIEQ